MKDRQETALAASLVREDDTLDGAAILRLLDKPLSADDLREATERVAHPLDLIEKDVRRLLIFQIGDETLAFDSVHINEVTLAVDVHRIPHRSNRIIRGLCNLDGELRLCGDLAKLLELNDGIETEARAKSQQRMIVIGQEQNRWVVEVDAVKGIATTVRKSFRRPPITVDEAFGRYTTNLVSLDGMLIALLDVDLVASGFQEAMR
ncbi:MAG: chemotaxis protein CheW [Pirellulales bacterium]